MDDYITKSVGEQIIDKTDEDTEKEFSSDDPTEWIEHDILDVRENEEEQTIVTLRTGNGEETERTLNSLTSELYNNPDWEQDQVDEFADAIEEIAES